MYYPEEYITSDIMNQTVINALNKKSTLVQYKLNEHETLRDDGEVITMCKTYIKERYALELKRRAHDTLISDYYKSGSYKYDSYQIPTGYSVEQARNHPVKFICYDNDMLAALIFDSNAINFDKSRYVRLKCEDSIYHYVKMYEVDLAKCKLIPLEV